MKITGIGGFTIQPTVTTTNDYGKQAWVISGQIEVRGRITTQGDLCNFSYKMFTQKQAEYNIKKMNQNAGIVFMGELQIVNGLPHIDISEIIEHTTNNYYFSNGQRGAVGGSQTGGQPQVSNPTVNAQRPTVTAQQPPRYGNAQSANTGIPTFPTGIRPQVQAQGYPTEMPVIDLNTVGTGY